MSDAHKPHSMVDEIRERVQVAEQDGWYGYDELARADVKYLVDQLEATEQRLAREISEHADREQALRQLQFLAVNGQNRHSDSLEALREIESRAREALNPASEPDA